MHKELEYKYKLCAKTYQKVCSLPELDQQSNEQYLVSHYYDTDDMALMKQGYALRILHLDGQYIQTLKGGGRVVGALHEREEWQAIVEGNRVQPDAIPLAHIQQILKTAIAENRLQQLFITDFTRTYWDIVIDDTHIELAIDQGFIYKGDKSTEIFELEIELISGELTVLDAFRRSIEQKIQLDAQPKSKAQRAYEL